MSQCEGLYRRKRTFCLYLNRSLYSLTEACNNGFWTLIKLSHLLTFNDNKADQCMYFLVSENNFCLVVYVNDILFFSKWRWNVSWHKAISTSFLFLFLNVRSWRSIFVFGIKKTVIDLAYHWGYFKDLISYIDQKIHNCSPSKALIMKKDKYSLSCSTKQI